MIKWTEQKVASEIMAIHEASGLMPTNTYLQAVGKSGLANKITKTGRFFAWAKRLGISRTHSDSDTGWDGEKKVESILKEKGFKAERQLAVRWPFDLLVDDIVRVDVKAAKFARYGPCSGWFYRIGKAPQADVIALVQLDTDVVYLIPWSLVPFSNITISQDGGKWAWFKNRFSVLKDMSEIRRKEHESFKQCVGDR